MERRRTFGRDFKLEAVKLVVERGVSVAQAAKDLDVHENVLQSGFVSCAKQKAQDAEITRLHKEVTKLKTESDMLNKAAGYFAKGSMLMGFVAKQESMTSQLVVDALMMAVWRQGRPVALLYHSDQGSQYTGEHFQSAAR